MCSNRRLRVTSPGRTTTGGDRSVHLPRRRAAQAFCRSIKNQKEADKTNPNIKRGPDEVILFFKLMYRECLQARPPPPLYG